jgi:hypothetical protein
VIAIRRVPLTIEREITGGTNHAMTAITITTVTMTIGIMIIVIIIILIIAIIIIVIIMIGIIIIVIIIVIIIIVMIIGIIMSAIPMTAVTLVGSSRIMTTKTTPLMAVVVVIGVTPFVMRETLFNINKGIVMITHIIERGVMIIHITERGVMEGNTMIIHPIGKSHIHTEGQYSTISNLVEPLFPPLDGNENNCRIFLFYFRIF